jgi:hypothetical protein
MKGPGYGCPPGAFRVARNPGRTMIVDAIREVAAAVEREVDEGHRAAQIDARDLVEIFPPSSCQSSFAAVRPRGI